MWPLVNKPLSRRLRDWLATIWQPLKSVAKRYTVLWYVWFCAFCCSLQWKMLTYLHSLTNYFGQDSKNEKCNTIHKMRLFAFNVLTEQHCQLSLCCTFSSKRLVQSRSLSYKLQATAAVCLSKTIASRGFYYPALSIDHLPTSQGLSNDW